ncbi:MAG: DUF4276 family protein [Bacteroidetes bacterium]|nr:DUF4276 family protein [Bacteroidota bacterium]
MKVIVYVEGRSDVDALKGLLRELIASRSAAGISIGFFESPKGDRKKTLLRDVPMKAVDILRTTPDSHVVALPDLYPPDIAFPHRTAEELFQGMKSRFREVLASKGDVDERIAGRFHVFCMKHDLEVLVLAAREQLAQRLGVSRLKPEWKEPVEEQNHDRPPKRVVKELFDAHNRKYRETREAALILGSADYAIIAERCPQCFKPFVEFLTSLHPAA